MTLRGLVKGLDDLYRNRHVQLLLITQGEAAVEPVIEFLLGPPSLHAEPRCLAAEALGIGRTTLWRKLKEYGIER